MDIVRDVKIDWLGMKWYFICFSLVLLAAGGVSLATQGLNLGVDFTGGTLVQVKFKESPNLEQIRQALSGEELRAEQVTRIDEPEANEVQIRLALVEREGEADLGLESELVTAALRQALDRESAEAGKLDLNSVGRGGLSAWLQEKDPDGLREERSVLEFAEHYDGLASRIADFRTMQRGILSDFSQLEGLGLGARVLEALEEGAYLGSFTVISVESVGPRVGQEMQKRARDAIIFSLLGMLAYIAVRFRPIYGLAAIIALFHDVFIAVGFFSITGKEITLTVIAGFLTLVGYSINDSIVIFDRVRENLKLMRRRDLTSVINASINQVLNRTILTSSTTFVAVFSLYMLGGEALSGFSFALVVGVIVGTYSSVAVATPVVVSWQGYVDRRKKAKLARA